MTFPFSISVTADGEPVVSIANAHIPITVKLELFRMVTVQGMTTEDAVTCHRGSLVPSPHTAYPFRRNTPETFLDKLRSIIATYIFRNRISEWKSKGVDFSTHLYVPEKDPITESYHHERADHNHLLKRIAKHTRDGKFLKLNCEAFDHAMLDKTTGLTHAALTGQRKQSVVDAERLLSLHVAKFFKDKGYQAEAEYVSIIANWHEASDGRGMTQFQRCKANYSMLNYVLDEWMPWHRETYDFSLMDINRFEAI